MRNLLTATWIRKPRRTATVTHHVKWMLIVAAIAVVAYLAAIAWQQIGPLLY